MRFARVLPYHNRERKQSGKGGEFYLTEHKKREEERKQKQTTEKGARKFSKNTKIYISGITKASAFK